MARDNATALHIGRHLRAARRAAGLTQVKAAERLGGTITQTTICNWESGRYIPTIPYAFALADAYQIPLAQLLGYPEGD